MMVFRTIWVAWGCLAAAFAASVSGAAATAQDPVRFNQEVRPILSNNCFHCHGPDEGHREAGLRLDVAGDIDLEEIARRVSSDDPDLVMPPADSHKSLKPEQIALLQRWVREGGQFQGHWAFEPVADVPPAGLKNPQWCAEPVDRYVLAKLEKKGLRPNPRADKRTLIRRVTFDLTGLPPTLEEIDAFLNDSSSNAYQRLVDRLLAKPQFGEHMAKYWLDLVRFADTNGLHHDHYREMTPYRDWVIRAFNDNLPFDDFITYQVAGDLITGSAGAGPTSDQLVASGFNRLHLIIDVGTALPEESFNRNVVDRVSAVGTAFMGLTLQCAVCHDHKYDPITQKDFYQLYAFFNNFDGEPETGGRGTSDFKRGLQPPYLEFPSESQSRELERLDGAATKLSRRIEALKASQTLAAQQVNKRASPGDDTADELEALTKKLEEIKQAREALIQAIPATLIMKERAEVRPAHILVRGAYDQPGTPVERATPEFLPPLEKESDIATRLDLANWLVDPDHPLTARVAVNRFWQQCFGVGLVKTSEDFGAQGQIPSHPDLLDHLTLRFTESGWDVKAILRTMVLSETYRQSSRAAQEDYLNDPENRMLARGSRFRLDSEVVRDQVLAVSGLLNPTMYGKSVKPPQPPWLWKIVTMPSSYPHIYVADTGPAIYRRSVYTFWKRAQPPPQMSIFDAPTREACIARRERTNTPLQALLLMNEEQFFIAARHLAMDLIDAADLNDYGRIRRAYETVTSQFPDEAVVAELQAALDEFRQLYEDDPTAAAAVANQEYSAQPSELAAWTMIVHSLLNLDETKTRQ